MKIARWPFAIFALSMLVCAGSALAQDQDNSIAAAARRAQEQKKSQPKAAHVYDNDSIPTTGHVNVVGQEPAPGTTPSSTTAQVVEQKPAPTAAEVASANADLDKAKQRLADLKADLDVAQRKYVLDQSTYLSDPNHSMNKAGAAALISEKSDVDAKAAAVADAEKALATAQAKADQTNKAAAAAAAQEKAAQTQAANNAAAQQSAQTAPAAQSTAPPQNQPAPTPDSDTATVDRQQ